MVGRDIFDAAECIGSQHVAEDEPEEPEPDAPVQVNWVDRA